MTTITTPRLRLPTITRSEVSVDAMTTGANANAACYVEVRVGDSPTGFGAGVDTSIVTASLKAVISGVNRHLAARDGGQAKAA